ncbi:MAG: ThuA domain-containing protein, partial [Candidatus Helarchaeota archaeon]|nr:ThuA domain-containing protein [Candidatus Helarchaeota archaeon]
MSQKAQAPKIKVCFDTTQSERVKLDENYTKCKELIEKMGFSVVSNLEFPLTFGQLSHFDIIFFACPDRSKIREFEIQELLRYVKCGGAIVVMASSGGDKGRMTNLNDLTNKFGIEFNNDQVFDDQHNYGIRNLAISTAFEDHPLTKGLELVIIPSSCSLTVKEKAKGVIFTDSDADPPKMPVIAISEYGYGRVIVLGSYDAFRDNVRAGIQVIQHRILLENMLNWAVKDKPLAQILFALSLLRIREKKEAKSAPALLSSSLPSTQGMVSPEALLDQILSNL